MTHSSHPDNHHVTVFMTSQPSDPRPDPFIQGGGFLDGLSGIPAPKLAILAKEVATYQALAAAASPPLLKVSHWLGYNFHRSKLLVLSAGLDA